MLSTSWPAVAANVKHLVISTESELCRCYWRQKRGSHIKMLRLKNKQLNGNGSFNRMITLRAQVAIWIHKKKYFNKPCGARGSTYFFHMLFVFHMTLSLKFTFARLDLLKIRCSSLGYYFCCSGRLRGVGSNIKSAICIFTCINPEWIDKPCFLFLSSSKHKGARFLFLLPVTTFPNIFPSPWTQLLISFSCSDLYPSTMCV